MAGERRYIGIGEEATFGTAVAAAQYLDFLRADIDAPDRPHLVFEGAGRSRSLVAPGVYIPSGSIELAVQPTQLGYWAKWFFGDYISVGTAPNPQSATTLAVAATAGDTAITVDDETGFQVGDYVQIGATWDEEVVQINALDSGGGPTYTWTLETALRHSHAIAVAVEEVVSPYTHTFFPSLSRVAPYSFTLRIGKGVFEQVFSGCVINRMSLRLERGFLTASLDIIAQKDAKGTLVTTAKSFLTDYLSVRLGNGTLRSGGDIDIGPKLEAISFDFNNNIDQDASIRHGSRFPVEFELGGMDVTGEVTFSFGDTSEYERFWGDADGPNNNLSATVTQFELERWFQGVTGQVFLLATNAYWTRVATPVTGRDRITQAASYESLSGPTWNANPAILKLINNIPLY